MGGDGYDEDTLSTFSQASCKAEPQGEHIERGVRRGRRRGEFRTYQEYDDISTIYTTVFGGR